jgi:sugar O-acyltransferase (sialic acid O-acetyltransferase NeuD family)
MKMQYAIYGSSGFGREVMPLLKVKLSNMDSQSYEISFVDDAATELSINGYPVIKYADWLKIEGQKHICVAIADSRVREKLENKCINDHVNIIGLSAKSSEAYDDVKMSDGAILCANTVLTSNIKIGKSFHANIYSYVAHDCVIGDYVTFAPAVKCNGNVVIEDHAYIGTGAIIKQGKPGQPLVIGKGAIVGMGAVVTKNVASGTTVVGNPAKPFIK